MALMSHREPLLVKNNAFRLTQQKPSAWSFEIEARPFSEIWWNARG
jgi:hypothetical protein